MNPLRSIRHGVDHLSSWRIWAVLLAAVLSSSVAAIVVPAAYALPPCAGPNPPPECDDPVPQAPEGAVTKVERSGGAVRVEGWARDPDDGSPITVRVSIPPRAVGQLVDQGDGFSGSFEAQDGDRLCATAVNPQTGRVRDLGCHPIAALAAPTDLRVTVVHDRALAADWQDGAGDAGYQILLRRDGDWYPVKDVPAKDEGRVRVQVPVPVSGSHCIRVRAVNDVVTSPPAEACATTLPAMPDRISMLNLNLQGTHQWYGPGGTQHVEWENRYDRVARWMQTTGTLPDLLALQEVYAFDWGEDAKPDVTDYETLFVLLDRIKARTNAEYRIAYLDTRLTEGITLRAGNAVLYNADRLRNTTPQPSLPPVQPFGAFSQTLHARASHWCNAPLERYRALCARIDGEGVYWTKSYTVVPGLGPSFSRFELRDHPGAPIHVYDVHAPNARDDTEPEPGRFYGFLKSMVAEVEGRWGSPSRLYPPIVAGDFNSTLADETAPEFAPGDVFADFERAAPSPNPDVVAILKGKVSAFPARHAGVAFPQVLPVDQAEEQGRCGTAAQAWSDHCATFVDIVPSSSPAERWDLAEHLHRSPGAANPGPDRLGRAGVWRLLGGAGLGIDPWNDRLMPAFNPAHMGVAGLGCWRQDPGDVNSLPVICGNTRGDNPRPFGIDWPPGTVLMHPSPAGSAIVAWRSPYSGTVRIDGAVRDLHGACGDGIEWTLAAGGTTLATGAIANGGQQDFSASRGASSLRRVHVRENETVYLAIGPGRAGDHACDSTGVSFTVTSERSWDLAEDYRRAAAEANPFADRVGRPGVWRFEGSAGLAHDPPSQRLLARLNPSRFGGLPGLECWQDASRDPNVLPIVCLSRRADNPWPLGIDWQPGGVVMHPSPGQAAIVGWRSPISGTVRIQGAIRDLHTACGDGVSWRLASGAETLAAGTIPNGGSQAIADRLDRVHVRVDESLYFVVGPGPAGDHGCDSTGVDLRITANPS